MPAILQWGLCGIFGSSFFLLRLHGPAEPIGEFLFANYFTKNEIVFRKRNRFVFPSYFTTSANFVLIAYKTYASSTWFRSHNHTYALLFIHSLALSLSAARHTLSMYLWGAKFLRLRSTVLKVIRFGRQILRRLPKMQSETVIIKISNNIENRSSYANENKSKRVLVADVIGCICFSLKCVWKFNENGTHCMPFGVWQCILCVWYGIASYFLFNTSTQAHTHVPRYTRWFTVSFLWNAAIRSTGTEASTQFLNPKLLEFAFKVQRSVYVSLTMQPMPNILILVTLTVLNIPPSNCWVDSVKCIYLYIYFALKLTNILHLFKTFSTVPLKTHAHTKHRYSHTLFNHNFSWSVWVFIHIHLESF